MDLEQSKIKVETRGRKKLGEKGARRVQITIPTELWESPDIQQLLKEYKLSKVITEFLQNRSK